MDSDRDSAVATAGTTAAAPATYHHGELSSTLMDLALAAIAEHGTEKLSLRALARTAGVSPTAPYRHFPSKQCLLAALATRGFIELGNRMQRDVRAHTAPADRLVALGLTYIEFARNNTVAYHLMFGSVLGDFSEYEMLHTAATESYGLVLAELDALIEQQQLPMTATELGGVVWAAVHGLASLMISQFDGEIGALGALSPPGESIRSLRTNPEQALRVLLSGLLST